jgi:uncharacterized protein (TIGR02996 family)
MQGIVDDPDDDARRLIVADWLEENGRSRESEFIRAQVQLARCVGEPADPFESPAGLWDRHLAPDLRRLFLVPWLPLAPGRGADEGARLDRLCRQFAFGFRRGFLDALVIYGSRAAGRFSQHAEALFGQLPLQHLCVSATAERPPREYPPEDDYDYEDALGPVGLESLLELPLLSRLRTLVLENHRLGDLGAGFILRCQRLPLTVRLRLDGNLITDALAGSLHARFGDRLRLTPFDPDSMIPF